MERNRMNRLRRKSLAAGSLLALLLAVVWTSAASSASTACTSPSGAKGPGVGSKTIGFIYVGSTSDFGYNEAAHEGATALGKACSNLKILEEDSIPETSDMTTAAEQEIAQGAKIIFSTSYGYKDYAVALATKHPDVAFLQQGNYVNPPMPKNLNTYFGNVYETVYLGGIAAGKATKSGKLGFVVAFPIAQTLLNINAFERGAQSVNPKAKTYVVFTGSWCDPGKQAEASNALIDQKIDVLEQHQDCTKTVIQTAERRGIFTTGYHVDASSLAPHGWLTGSEWDWGPLMVKMVKIVEDGRFRGSPYSGIYRTGVPSGVIKLAPFGAAATPAIRKQVTATYDKLKAGWIPFKGPIRDQSGKVRVAVGVTPNRHQLESTDYFVQGVVGKIPGGG